MEANEEFIKDTLELGGLNITCYRSGEHGSPVFLLHGGGTDSAMLSWRYALPYLAKEHQVFAPDWPGYGQSDPISGPYQLDRLVPIVVGLMDHYAIERASLVGLSMGGGASIAFCLAHPERVDRLVLVDTYGIQRQVQAHFLSYLYIRLPFLVNTTWAALRRDKRMTRTAVRAIFADPEGCSDDFIDEVYAAIQNPGGAQAFYNFQRYELLPNRLRTNFTSRLPEITAPTLFIHGDNDRLVPLDEIRQVAAAMPDARLEVLEKTGHWPPREHPDLFHQLVGDFLRVEE